MPTRRYAEWRRSDTKSKPTEYGKGGFRVFQPFPTLAEVTDVVAGFRRHVLAWMGIKLDTFNIYNLVNIRDVIIVN